MTSNIIAEVSAYYGACLARHGPNARGVDWNGEISQRIRFEQLCKILPEEGKFDINDLGCGYGALVEYLTSKRRTFRYHGYDVSPAMIDAARKKYFSPEIEVSFSEAATPTFEADFGMASGIFNVQLSNSSEEWRDYMEKTLDSLAHTSRRGFAFNCLTYYSDADKIQPNLHYAHPCYWFDHCKRHYSRQVALLHDYNLWEFTILVR
jgi:SAM-dependent methyltransferase